MGAQKASLVVSNPVWTEEPHPGAPARDGAHVPSLGSGLGLVYFYSSFDVMQDRIQGKVSCKVLGVTHMYEA